MHRALGNFETLRELPSGLAAVRLEDEESGEQPIGAQPLESFESFNPVNPLILRREL